MADASNITIDEARNLVADRVLWPHVRDFLWDFAAQIHPSWIKGLEIEVQDGSLQAFDFQRLADSPRVKAHVLRQLGVKPVFYEFPKEDWSRLLLLDGATLLEIAKWLGAISCADSLRRVTDGATVRALKAALPGIYPEAFSYTMYFTCLAAKNAGTAEEVLHSGLATLLGIIKPLPASLVARLKFKLPKSLCDLCVPCDERKEPSSVNDAVKKLLKLKFPEAYSLCC